MASHSRSIRILSLLDAAFRQDPHIEEYDVIPVLEPVSNKSPLVLIDHKLGVELWCIKDLYLYTYTKLMGWRRCATVYLESEVIVSLSRAVLLVNPELATVWNIRKELVHRGDLDTDPELTFSALVLSKHPKSPETFSHRRWVLSHLHKSHNPPSEPSTLPACLPSELRVCHYAADRYPCNYAAWSHRAWVVGRLPYNHKFKVVREELAATERWVSSHVSDHSGFHYRQFLINSLISHSNLSSSSQLGHRDLINDESLNSDPNNPRKTNRIVDKSANTDVADSDQIKLHTLNHDPLNHDPVNHDLDNNDVIPDSKINDQLNSSVVSSNNEIITTTNQDVPIDLNTSCQDTMNLILCDLDTEHHLTSDLLTRYPEHQAVWYHRRFCVHTLLTMANLTPSSTNQCCSSTNPPTPPVTQVFKRTKLDCRHSIIANEATSRDFLQANDAPPPGHVTLSI